MGKRYGKIRQANMGTGGQPMTPHAYTLHLIENATEAELKAMQEEIQTDLQALRELNMAGLIREKETELNVIKNLLISEYESA